MQPMDKDVRLCDCVWGQRLLSVEKRNKECLYLLIALLHQLSYLSELKADCLQTTRTVCLNVIVIRSGMPQGSTEPE